MPGSLGVILTPYTNLVSGMVEYWNTGLVEYWTGGGLGLSFFLFASGS